MTMENEMTAEYANGYMAGVDAERARVIEVINNEMNARPKPAPLDISHWTNYLLKLINVDGRSRTEVLEEMADGMVQDMINKLTNKDKE
jgi:hypothetical protein